MEIIIDDFLTLMNRALDGMVMIAQHFGQMEITRDVLMQRP